MKIKLHEIQIDILVFVAFFRIKYEIGRYRREISKQLRNPEEKEQTKLKILKGGRNIGKKRTYRMKEGKSK